MMMPICFHNPENPILHMILNQTIAECINSFSKKQKDNFDNNFFYHQINRVVTSNKAKMWIMP